jgi:hypothetical protein
MVERFDMIMYDHSILSYQLNNDSIHMKHSLRNKRQYDLENRPLFAFRHKRNKGDIVEVV